jgi:PAS domain S-box-containing protein
LQQDEAHFRALIENSSDIITVLDLDGTIRFESPSFERLLGYAQHEIDGRIAFDFMHPDDLPNVLDKFQQIVQRPGETQTAEFRFRHKDGSWRSFEGVGRGTYDSHGRPCVIANSRDITERKQVQETLRLSEERFRSLFEHSPVAYQSLDREGRFIDVNQKLCHLLGYEKEELLGREFGDLWVDDAQGNFHKAFEDFKKSGKVRNELALRHRDGTIVNVVIDGRVQRDTNGEFLRTHCILTDISAHTRAENALRQSERRLNEAQRIAQIGSWELDLTTNRLEWSDEIYRIFEIERESFGASYEAFLSLVHPDDRSIVDCAYSDSVRMKTPYEIVHRILMPGGRVKYVHERCETVYDAQGMPQRSFGTVQDVTEHTEFAQRETARLTQLKKLYEFSMTLSGDPAVIFNHAVRMIGQLFHVRVVCLSEIVGQELYFKSVYVDGRVVADAGHCSLDITPCATVERSKELQIFDRVMEHFPQASFLRDHQAVSYCGFPALDSAGRVVAVTCLLDDKPHEFSQEEQDLLRIFGQRIATEIERHRHMVAQQRVADELRCSHAFIRQVIDTVPNFIFAKDREGRSPWPTRPSPTRMERRWRT